jgi:hypothetical protein
MAGLTASAPLNPGNPPTDIYRSPEELKDVPHAGAARRALGNLKPDPSSC